MNDHPTTDTTQRHYTGNRFAPGTCHEDRKVYRHQPTGAGSVFSEPLPTQPHECRESFVFEWGGGAKAVGAAARHLAFALIADCMGVAVARRHYEQFAEDVVVWLEHEQWTLTETRIREWIEHYESFDRVPPPAA